jgi:sugar lactone lactonase YvrE
VPIVIGGIALSVHRIDVLLEGGDFFEGLRWRDSRWWVADQDNGQILSLSPKGEVGIVTEIDGSPSGLGWLPNGDLLIASMKDKALLRLDSSGKLETFANLHDLSVGSINDMAVSRAGYSYVGCVGYDEDGPEDTEVGESLMICVSPDGLAFVAATGLACPNGASFTADEQTLIVGESLGNRYTAFAIQSDGSLLDRRVWAQFGPTPEYGPFNSMLNSLNYIPDGCDIDRDGFLWSVDLIGNRCCRISEGGTVHDVIHAEDGQRFVTCALGGKEGKTLAICSAPGWDRASRLANPKNAKILVTSVEIGRF